MSFTLDCNHIGMYFPKKNGGHGPELHKCTDACRHMHRQTGPYISMRAPNTTVVVIVTPIIVALTMQWSKTE